MATGDSNSTDPSRGVDDPSTGIWRGAVNKNLITVISYLNNPTGAISNADYQGALAYLQQQQSAHPDDYQSVADDVTGFVEASGGSIPGQDSGTSVSDLLSKILGSGGSGGPSNRNSTRTSVGGTESNNVSDSNTLTQQRVYVDVPTAEEFLDDWKTGFRTGLQDALDSGTLSGAAYNLALNQEDRILDEYLGELGQRAARGEEIFHVVGANGEPKREGQRIGNVAQRGQVGTEVGYQHGTDRTSTDTTTTPVAGTPGAGGAGAGGAGGSGSVTTNDTITTDEQTGKRSGTVDTEHSATQEEIYSRPNLGVVKNLSPADFLKEKFAQPGSLETYLRAHKGDVTRERQTATGSEVLQARRVG